jgi:hypothetical protein
MATNLNIEPGLLEQAVEAGKHRSKRAAVEEALREYINHRKQKDMLSLFGQIEYSSDYDDKAARRKPCGS